MINYVCGFLFSSNYTFVALINKTKPEWQNGLLNGIGGKIEEGETSGQAMEREFEEETGVHIANPEWQYFSQITNVDQIWKVDFFSAVSEKVFELKSTTEEKVELIEVKTLLDHTRVIPNLKWLIPMAMDKEHNFCDASSL